VSVTPGVVPAISPDGHLLAYARNATNRCNPDFNELVVRDLSSGRERSWRWAGRTGPDLGSLLSWAPDGRHLGFDAVAGNARGPRLLDTATATSLDDATPIPHAPGTTWSGFLGTTGASLGARPWPGQGLPTPVDVLELDGSTGAVRRVLFTIPGSLSTGNGLDGSEGLIRSDASGRHVLWQGGRRGRCDDSRRCPCVRHRCGRWLFRNAFPGLDNGAFAAWCMVETPARHCYDESAVSADGSKVHIATAGCGSPAGPPAAGPAYWTF
jgi:hypothetical protein